MHNAASPPLLPFDIWIQVSLLLTLNIFCTLNTYGHIHNFPGTWTVVVNIVTLGPNHRLRGSRFFNIRKTYSFVPDYWRMGSNCKFWGNKPQFYLIIIRE